MIRRCNKCRAAIEPDREAGSPNLMAHLRAEHPERFTIPLADRLRAVVEAAEHRAGEHEDAYVVACLACRRQEEDFDAYRLARMDADE
jgi:hypothetical protein